MKSKAARLKIFYFVLVTIMLRLYLGIIFVVIVFNR